MSKLYVNWRELVNALFLALVTLTILFQIQNWVSLDGLGIIKLSLIVFPFIALIFSAYLFIGFFKEHKDQDGGRYSWKW